MTQSRFQQLEWLADRILLDDLIFRIEYERNDSWELGEECFVFYKNKTLVDMYEKFLAMRPDFAARNVFELGIWDGGSVAFWFEMLGPEKHVAIDLSPRGDSVYFKRYLEKRQLVDRVRTHWGVDQADSARLRDLVAKEFSGPLDLVVDDASHMYVPTKTSFETLFPLLRPGGLYLIEDWAWEHCKQFHAAGHPWSGVVSLTPLVRQLTEATGSYISLISSLTVFQGFVAVERGPHQFANPAAFRLEDYIERRPAALQPPGA